MEKIKSEDVMTLSTGAKVKILTWPMRPALRHVRTLNRLERLTAQDSDDAVPETDVDAMVAAIVDGSEMSKEAVEKLGLADCLRLLNAIAELNCRPLRGLLNQKKTPKAPSSTPPAS